MIASELAPLIDALSRLTDRVGEGIQVSVTVSDLVAELRCEVDLQRAEYAKLREQYNRTEYLYRCEVMINSQLTDYIREQRIDVPKHLFEVNSLL